MTKLALLQPGLVELTEDAPRFIRLAAEPVKQLWKMHPNLNISTLVSPTTNLVRFHNNQLERRRTCYSNIIETAQGNSAGSSSSLSPAMIGGIVGGILGALALFTLIALFPWIFIRRRRLRLQEQHRQENLSKALTGASAHDPHSRRASRIASPTSPSNPTMMPISPGAYDMNSGIGSRTSMELGYTAAYQSPASPDWRDPGGGGRFPTELTPPAKESYFTPTKRLPEPHLATGSYVGPGRSYY